MNKLLENNALINEKDNLGRDSLMYCVIENNLDLLKLLISKSKNQTIKKNAKDNKGKTLISLCVAVNDFGSYENIEMLKYLIKNDFDYISKDNEILSPLDLSLRQISNKNYIYIK